MCGGGGGDGGLKGCCWLFEVKTQSLAIDRCVPVDTDLPWKLHDASSLIMKDTESSLNAVSVHAVKMSHHFELRADHRHYHDYKLPEPTTFVVITTIVKCRAYLSPHIPF